MHLSPAEKQAVIHSYLEAGGYDLMIETGIWAGNGAGHQMRDLATIVMVDIDQGNCDAARRYAGIGVHPVYTVCGDSAVALADVLRVFDRPALFWLDAHSVEELDGKTESPCPLLAELEAILAWPHAAASTVLIDDRRLLGEQYGWPEVAEVAALLHSHDYWTVDVDQDIIRSVPRMSLTQPDWSLL